MKTEQDQSALQLLLLLIIGIPLSILVSLYGTLLTAKIIEWYQIPATLTFKQLFGINSIVAIWIMGRKKSTEKWYKSIFESAFVISFLFGMLFIVSKLF